MFIASVLAPQRQILRQKYDGSREMLSYLKQFKFALKSSSAWLGNILCPVSWHQRLTVYQGISLAFQTFWANKQDIARPSWVQGRIKPSDKLTPSYLYNCDCISCGPPRIANPPCWLSICCDLEGNARTWAFDLRPRTMIRHDTPTI